MIYKYQMTMKPHLLFSSLIHAILIAYLISIPIYKGSLYSISFGPYSVDLVSEERQAIKSSTQFNAPLPKAQPSIKSQAAITKPEAPPAVEVAKPEEPESENSELNEPVPPGISLMPEERKKEPFIAKAEVPVIEHKPAPEKKPEPPKVEPVILPPPPEPKPEPVPIKQEPPKPIEPEPVPPAETKPSKADAPEEPARSEFPVKVDEKAPEVSPAGKTKKDNLLGKEVISSGSKAADITDKKTDRETAKTAPASISSGKKENSTVSKKGGKKRGGKAIVPAAAKSSAQIREAASPSNGNTSGDSGTGNSGDSSKKGEGKLQTAGITVPEAKKVEEPPLKKPSLGVAVSDALFYRDIKVEVFLHKAETSSILGKLYKKVHPSDEGHSRLEHQAIGLTEDSESEGKMIFSVAKAEKGIYTFVMINTGETLQKTSLMIRLLEGKKGARNRKFESVNLKPHTQLTVKFILPEGIFWDDESYFTGSIESSDSVTKFNDTAGIVWKEDKEE
jgi:hypothetical protein